MMALVGAVVVIVATLGGFTIAGGHIPVLFHVSEFVTIGGVTIGTVLISTPFKVIKATFAKIKQLLKKDPFDRALYLDALKLLYEFFQLARKDGLVAVEAHIEAPAKSAVFAKYPKVIAQHHAVEFFCDSMRLVIAGSVPPHDLEAMMDEEIDVHHHAEAQSVGTVQKVGDALPGIGIVAAVLGIVVTMSAISGPVEVIGEKVGAALTGTFLGILAAYGFLNPLATSMEFLNESEARFYYFFKAAVVASAKGFPPIVAVEFARRAISAESRPTFSEMETACTGKAKE
jgi:chemotaxis protein MotA